MKPFDPTRPVQTRNGGEAKIMECPALAGGETMVGWYIDHTGRRCVGTWFRSGSFTIPGEHHADLVNVPAAAAAQGFVSLKAAKDAAEARSPPLTIDPSKPVQTRAGKPAFAVACEPLAGGDVLVGWFEHRGARRLGSWQANGQFRNNGPGDEDLVNVPTKHKGWANISDHPLLYPTKAAADRAALHDRIACIEIEFEEGQGID